MAFWLYKSEPFKWSWQMQKDAGAKGTEWTGVRNYLGTQQHAGDADRRQGLLLPLERGARNRRHHRGLRACRIRIRPPRAMPAGTASTSAPFSDVPRPVTLKEIKDNPKLAKMALVT